MCMMSADTKSHVIGWREKVCLRWDVVEKGSGK